jgi:serine protease Do
MIKSWSLSLLVGLQMWASLVGHAHGQATLGIDDRVGTAAGWKIGYNNSLSGCVASETYSDGTTIWFGIDGRDRSFFLALTNPSWKSIEEGKDYLLRFSVLGGGRYQGKFVGISRADEKGVVSGGLNEKFVGDVVHSSGIAVSLGDTTVARLSLQGSSTAMSAVIQCQGDRGGESGSYGSGFFITSSGHILTAAHVVKDCTKLDLQQPGGLVRSGRVLATDEQNDLAVIVTDMTPPAVAAIRTDVRLGENIAVFGFPLSGKLSTSGNFTVGYVSALAGYKDNSAQIQISAPIQPGNSGGPVFDLHGNVLAVIVSVAKASIIAQNSEVMPQNINFAIKSAIALTFLSSNGVKPDAEVDTKTSMDTAELADRSKARTVKIDCAHRSAGGQK